MKKIENILRVIEVIAALVAVIVSFFALRQSHLANIAVTEANALVSEQNELVREANLQPATIRFVPPSVDESLSFRFACAYDSGDLSNYTLFLDNIRLPLTLTNDGERSTSLLRIEVEWLEFEGTGSIPYSILPVIVLDNAPTVDILERMPQITLPIEIEPSASVAFEISHSMIIQLFQDQEQAFRIFSTLRNSEAENSFDRVTARLFFSNGQLLEFTQDNLSFWHNNMTVDMDANSYSCEEVNTLNIPIG